MKLVIFDLDDTLFDRFGQLDETYKNLLNITPFPDTHNVLSSLGFKKILVSLGDGRIQNKKIDVLKIRGFFDEIFICSTTEEKKEIFESVMKRYGAGDMFVVGDRIDSEIRFGNMLGMKTILILHGKYKDLKPKDNFEVADYTIDRLEQLLEIV